MSQGLIILLIILVASILSRNSSVAIATCALILIKLLKLNTTLNVIANNGLNVGIIILTMGILAPLAQDKINFMDAIKLAKTPAGIITVLSGIVVTILTTRGIKLMQARPDVITNLILGTVIGVGAFNGTPVGPMIAAGIAGLIINIFHLF